MIEEGIITKRKKEGFLTKLARFISNRELERFNLFTNIFHSFFLRFMTYIYAFILIFLGFKFSFKIFVLNEANLKDLKSIFIYAVLSLIIWILFFGVKKCLDKHENYHNFD